MLSCFSKFELVFAVSAYFHNQVLFFVCVFSWNNEYILDNISRIRVQRILKAYIHFANNILPIDTVILNLSN